MRVSDLSAEEEKANAAIEIAALEALCTIEALRPPDLDHKTFVRAVLDRIEAHRVESSRDALEQAALASAHRSSALALANLYDWRHRSVEGESGDLPAALAAHSEVVKHLTVSLKRLLRAAARRAIVEKDAPRPYLGNPASAAVQVVGIAPGSAGRPAQEGEGALASEAVARALERGKLARAALEADEGGSQSSEQVAALLGVTRQAVDQRRRARHLVAWQDSSGHWRFPVWQFDPQTARPYPGLAPILAALPGDPWSDMIFFLSRDETLGARPLDLLRGGRAKRVVPAALRYGRS
jgi:hypothetical protein